MAITALPTPPSRSSPDTFSDLADAFLGALPTFVTEANALAAAMDLNDVIANSTTELGIAVGTQKFDVEVDKSFQPGMYVIVAYSSAATAYMGGTVVDYDSSTGSMEIYVDVIGGTAASYSDWIVTMSAPYQDFASPGPIGETTPDTIRGKNKEIYRTCTADGALTVAECSGTIVSFLGLTDAACDIPLPTAEEGLSFMAIFPTERAQVVRLRADTNDQIYLLGVHGADNGYVGFASGWAHGSCFSMFTFKNTDAGWDWFCIPIFGSVVAS